MNMGKQFFSVPVEEWGIFPEGKPMIIAGPCSAESEKQVMETAAQLKAAGVNVFRAGIWKPRTHPNTFEGVGTTGLKWLQRVQNEFGMKVCTEIVTCGHLADCLEHGVDMVWLGARTTSNPYLVQEIAKSLSGSDLPVLVKNPINPDIELWVGALERLGMYGIEKIGVVHRGFSTYEKTRYRNKPDWQIAVELRSRCPEIPFFCDPSHISGSRDYIEEISQRAMDLGLDGLMVESHCNPDCALSDAGQQITPSELSSLLKRLVIRKNDSNSPEYKENIDQLRAQIDVIDEELLSLLGSRMKVSRQIGEYKKKNNIAILQTSRWDSVLSSVLEKGAAQGLPEKFVTDIFNMVHDASVRIQNDILSGSQDKKA